MKNIFLFFTFLMTGILIFSCVDDDEFVLEAPPKYYISNIKSEDSTLIAEFYYDEDKQIDEVVVHNTNQAIQIEIRYRGELISRYEYKDLEERTLQVIEVEYNPDELISRLKYTSPVSPNSDSLQVDSILSFQYNEEKFLVEEYKYKYKELELVEDSTLDLTTYKVYTYNSRDNIALAKGYVKTRDGEEAELEYQIEFAYDDNYNPYNNMTFIYEFTNLSNNNVREKTWKNKLGIMDLKKSYTSEYEYYDFDYPKKETRNPVGREPAESYFFEYYSESDIFPTERK
jgi:hypothetical protein